MARSTSGNTLGITCLVLDDSQDTTGQTATACPTTARTGQVTGLSPATINYADAGISSLTVNGGSGGNTFTVDGTLDNPDRYPSYQRPLNTGTGDDTTGSSRRPTQRRPLNIHGADTVKIGV